MLPKSSKHFIVPTAEDLSVDAQLVEDAVSFYYSKVRKALSNLELHNIRLENLGTFRAKPKELPKLYAKYTRHLGVIKADTFRQMAIKKEIESKLEKVIKMQDIMVEEAERKRKHKEIRNEYIRKNMGGKETDS